MFYHRKEERFHTFFVLSPNYFFLSPSFPVSTFCFPPVLILIFPIVHFTNIIKKNYYNI